MSNTTVLVIFASILGNVHPRLCTAAYVIGGIHARLVKHETNPAIGGHLPIVGENESTYSHRPLDVTSNFALRHRGSALQAIRTSRAASDDLKRASELAINMVGSLGFSDALGLLSVASVPKERLGPDIQAGVLREACARVLLQRAQATCQQLVTELKWE